MTSTGDILENMPIDKWLAELHMECYKKNLEKYNTIKPLLDLKESELKKLGVQNSKDRSVLMGSLANYRIVRHETKSSAVSQATSTSHESKSIFRKSSMKKLKGLLGTSHKKRGKKSGVLISAPAMPTTLVEEPSMPSPQVKLTPDTIPDYDEVPEVTRSMTMAAGGERKVLYAQAHKAVENEYVPSPESSPKFENCRVRSYTVADVGDLPHAALFMDVRGSTHAMPFVLPPPRGRHDDLAVDGQKHLSIVSMESGLSFGYDAEKEDFNPSASIDSQPWFHGVLNRSQAEELLLEDGDFLLRENTSLPVTYTLSVRYEGACEHMLIASADVLKDGRIMTLKYQLSNGAFDSIPELIFNHLRYHIPVNKASGATITNPVCKPGSKGLNYASYAPSVGAESPTSHTLPKNFGSQHQRSNSDTSQAPGQPTFRNSRCLSTNSGNSPTDVSMDTPCYRTSSSSTDLLVTRGEEEEEEEEVRDNSILRKRSLSKTVSSPVYNTLPARLSSAGNHQRAESFEDYQVMVSASSVLEGIPNPSPSEQVATTKTSPPSSEQVAIKRTNSPVKYADLKSILTNVESAPRVRKTSAVNYVEVRFDHGPSNGPHTPAMGSQSLPRKGILVEPFDSDADSPYQSRAKLLAQRVRTGDSASAKHASELREIGSNDSPYQSRAAMLAQRARMSDASPPTARLASEAEEVGTGDSPYQSRAKVLAQRVLTDVESPYQPRGRALTCVSSIPSHNACSNVIKTDADANYSIPKPHASLIGMGATVTTPYSLATSRQMSDSLLLSAPSHSDGPTYDIPGKHLQRSISGGPSPVISSAGSPMTQLHFKTLQGLPGGDALFRMHTLLSSYTNSEVAYHLTKADAVTFMLSPRPGESVNIWTERIRKPTSRLYVGLQTLADPDGEKLWKKLYSRYWGVAHMVSLCIVSAGDPLSRAKTLHRFIDLAYMLQGKSFGNVFSAMAILYGIIAPQIAEMSDVWSLLHAHFPEVSLVFNTELKPMVDAFAEGTLPLDPSTWTIPPVHSLKAVYHYDEPWMKGYPVEDKSLVGDYITLSQGMYALHTVIANCAQFYNNAHKMLSSYSYNAVLFDFFMQDCSRSYMQQMGVTSDDPLERRRKCSQFLDTLVKRL